MPRAPPSSRVVSLTAEPTPALDSGHGAHDPAGRRRGDHRHAGRKQHHGDDEHEVRRVDADHGHQRHADADDAEPVGDRLAAADARGDRRAARRDDHEGGGERQRGEPGLERRVPTGELQVEGEEEEEAEHHEERRRDHAAADAEAAVLEVGHRQHRMRSDPLPAHERNAEHGGGDEGDDDDRIGPAAFRPLDDPEEQRAEADEMTPAPARVERRRRVVTRARAVDRPRPPR